MDYVHKLMPTSLLIITYPRDWTYDSSAYAELSRRAAASWRNVVLTPGNVKEPAYEVHLRPVAAREAELALEKANNAADVRPLALSILAVVISLLSLLISLGLL